jgi:hypothetical protein
VQDHLISNKSPPSEKIPNSDQIRKPWHKYYTIFVLRDCKSILIQSFVSVVALALGWVKPRKRAIIGKNANT